MWFLTVLSVAVILYFIKYREKYAEKSQGNDYYWINASLHKLAAPGIAKQHPNKHAFNSLNNYNAMYI